MNEFHNFRCRGSDMSVNFMWYLLNESSNLFLLQSFASFGEQNIEINEQV